MLGECVESVKAVRFQNPQIIYSWDRKRVRKMCWKCESCKISKSTNNI